MARLSLTLAALVALAGSPAAADQLPPLHPTRDVVVTYQIEAAQPGKAGQSQIVRMYWGDGGERLRVEIGGQHSVALVDFAARRIHLLVGGKQPIVVEAPFDDRLIPGFVMPAGVTAKRIGAETVADVPCSLFALTGRDGDGQVCITSDGVVLRAQGAARQASGALQAVSVSYGPQPASLFEVPPAARRMDLKPPRQ